MGEVRKKGRRCVNTAREQARTVTPGSATARSVGYPSAAELAPGEWAKVQRAMHRVAKSATVAGLMALSGAMFGGCMPAVRPDMRAMGAYPGTPAAEPHDPNAPSFDSGASTTERDVASTTPPSQDQAPTTGATVTEQDRR